MDVAHEVAAVRRSVERVERRGRPAWALIAESQFAAPPSRVWQAVTDQQELSTWFLPVRGELGLGKRFELQGNAAGTVLACEAPQALLTTWEYNHDTSWLEVHVRETGSGSESEPGSVLTLVHTAHVPDDAWAHLGPGAAGVGWDLTLHSLHRHLAPADGAAFGAGAWSAAQAREFHDLASQAWAAANISAGADGATARAAAARVTAFYTGEPEPEQGT